ncbi:hypothetical protein L1887_39900 [Cichorium endivia]|nr:hypothetical protein L1887_39900 [Cichorium endivia]
MTLFTSVSSTSTLIPVSIFSATPPPDPAAEERNRKERKKRILLKLKTKYQLEIRKIHQWEHFSNTLKALQDCAKQNHYRRPQEATVNEVSTLCPVAESHCTAEEKLLQQPLRWLCTEKRSGTSSHVETESIRMDLVQIELPEHKWVYKMIPKLWK